MKRYTILTGILAVIFLASGSVSYGDAERKESRTDIALRHLNPGQVTKSGTPALMRLLTSDTEDARAFKAAYYEAERPEMEAHADSESGFFRVHYNLSGKHAPDLTDADNNGVPDYVDSTLVYLDYAWQIIIEDLGYGQPRYDGTLGGLPRDTIDCYLQELSTGAVPVYGLTQPDGSAYGSVSSYITLDNNFSESNIYYTTGYDALKITAAHEFFHVIHYTYYGNSDTVWWMEHTAVWMEDRAWDNVNDYRNYLGYLFTDRNIPLDTSNGSFEYGASIFAFYIAEKYGDDMIRTIWRTIRDVRNGRIENLNAVLPDGLSQAISELAVWLYFTGGRANDDDFFRDADIIPYVMKPDKMTTSDTTVDSLSFRHYTFKYVDILPDDGFSYGDSLYFNFEDRNEGLWKNQVILYSDPYNYEVLPIIGDSGAVAVPRPFDRAVLVTANVSERNKYYTLVYSIDIMKGKGVSKEPFPALFAIRPNFPNPFNNVTTIPYSIRETSHVTLEVKNIQGATVARLVSEVMNPGEYAVSFDARGMSSGPYFAVLSSGTGKVSTKMTLIK